jgi:hypothetical protein
MNRGALKALRVVESILFVVLGFLIGLIGISLYASSVEPKHLACVYLNVTSTGNSGADVLIVGIGNQTLVVKNSIYASVVNIDGVTALPITINEPPHNRVVVYSTRCNPFLQVYLVFPNGTTIYGNPRPINDQ